ncbi:MAG: class I SAM-dependent RNA methyltransferase [Bacilli bacterium]|nr:class I SAM-dependent RNA methyltransferase [Bacilli bacterium]
MKRLQKNTVDSYKIESLDHQGRGITYSNGKVVFVENALPTEEVLIKVLEDKKKYSNAIVTKYNSYSKERIDVECPYYDICGGCNISHLNYENQLKFKEDKLKNILLKYSNLNVSPKVIKSDNEFYYRNKISLKINDNKWGYYKENTHNHIEINHCMISKESINKILKFKNLFNIKNGEITIRSNYNDEILINIETDSKYEIDINKLKKDNKIAGIIANDEVIYNQDFFFEKIDEYLFKVNYKSFFQVNFNILDKVFELIKQKEYQNIIDLYCGVGTLGIPIKKEKLYGIEITPSINDAVYNCRLNKQKNNSYILGDSSKIKEIEDDIDLIVVDPPRKGIDNKTLDHIIAKKVSNIIYMSCDPITLSRDLNMLKEHYEIKSVYLFDMFPQTYHIETVVFMERIVKKIT